MMHKIRLTEAGEALANTRADFDSDDVEMYPEHVFEPGLAGAWTVADDILVLLNGPATIRSDTASFKDQQAALLEAMADFHPRVLIVEGFKALCREGLVDCIYNMYNVVEDSAEVFDALSNPVRLHILKHCLDDPATAGELKNLVGKSTPAIYHHVTHLRRTNLMYALGHGEGYVTDGEMLASILHNLIEFFYPKGGSDGTNMDSGPGRVGEDILAQASSSGPTGP